jgi:MFS family permease
MGKLFLTHSFRNKVRMPTTATTPAPRETSLSNRGKWLVLLAAFLGWGFDGMEQGIFPLIANPALTELTGGAAAAVPKWVGFITAAWLLGAACGGFVFGWLGDRIGRVRAMALSVLVYSLFTGLGYFAQAPWHLFGLRFLAALGMGGEWSLGVALVMECWPEKWRPWLAGAIGAAANVGFLLIGVLGFFYKVTPATWRYVMLAGAAPALLTFIIRLFVPESPKWKESVRVERPRPVREIAASRMLTGRTVLAIGLATVALVGTWGAIQQIPVWVDKQLMPGNPSAKGAAIMASAIGAIIGCVCAPLLGARIGRRPAYFTLCGLSLAASMVLFWGMGTYNWAFLGMVVLVGGLTASFYGWLPLYLPELFPTRVRATGQGVAFNFGRVLTALTALNIGPIVNLYGGSYAMMGGTVCLVYVLGMALIWLGPETRGQAMPE